MKKFKSMLDPDKKKEQKDTEMMFYKKSSQISNQEDCHLDQSLVCH